MTMTYTPSWEKKSNRWDTEPDTWELLEQEELENAKEYKLKLQGGMETLDLLEQEQPAETVVPQLIVCVLPLPVVTTVVFADEPFTTIAKVLLSPIWSIDTVLDPEPI